MPIRTVIERPYLRARMWCNAPQKNEGPTSSAGRVEWGRVAALPPAWGRALDDAGLPHRWIVWVAAPGPARLAIVELRLRTALAFVRSLGIDREAFAKMRRASPDLRVGRTDASSVTQRHETHAAELHKLLATYKLAPVEHIIPPELTPDNR